jgi:hypothetical protein
MLVRLRRFAVLCLAPAVAAAVLVAGPAGAGPNDPTVLFGARPEPGNQQGTTALEGQIGRQLAAVRVYYNWDSPFPDADLNWFVATGHPLLLSVKSERVNHSFVQWRAIADAQPGSARSTTTSSPGRPGSRTSASTCTSPSTTSRRRR